MPSGRAEDVPGRLRDRQAAQRDPAATSERAHQLSTVDSLPASKILHNMGRSPRFPVNAMQRQSRSSGIIGRAGLQYRSAEREGLHPKGLSPSKRGRIMSFVDPVSPLDRPTPDPSDPSRDRPALRTGRPGYRSPRLPVRLGPPPGRPTSPLTRVPFRRPARFTVPAAPGSPRLKSGRGAMPSSSIDEAVTHGFIVGATRPIT